MSTASMAIHELQARAQRGLNSEAGQLCLDLWKSLGLVSPSAIWFPRQVLPYAALLKQLFDVVEDGPVDAVLFADERRHAPKHNLRDFVGHLQVPIIDLSGRANEFADVFFDLAKPETWTDTAKCLLAFRDRRAKLTQNARNSIETELQWLGHAYVSGRSLTPRRYPLAKEAICYPGFASAETTIPVAEALSQKKLLKKRFFDRMHACRHCDSRRLSVREECPSCRSPELTEVELIHHYHCAALLPEMQFRQGSALVCPKCSQQLRNYGKDYDKPGLAVACAQCHKSTSEPEVGFVCLDCSAEFKTSEARQFDIYAYDLTDAAVELLTSSPSVEHSSAPLDDWRARIAAESRKLAIAEIRYAARDQIVATQGEAVFERLRRLFLENMTNSLGKDGEYRGGPVNDYFLLTDYNDNLSEEMSKLLEQSSSILATKIDPQVRLATRSARG